jgi:hypothetical protein
MTAELGDDDALDVCKGHPVAPLTLQRLQTTLLNHDHCPYTQLGWLPAYCAAAKCTAGQRSVLQGPVPLPAFAPLLKSRTLGGRLLPPVQWLTRNVCDFNGCTAVRRLMLARVCLGRCTWWIRCLAFGRRLQWFRQLGRLGLWFWSGLGRRCWLGPLDGPPRKVNQTLPLFVWL